MRNFIPDKSAFLIPPWNTVELSQRDVSLQIPLDYVTLPAVSLSAACFGAGLYEDDAARKCISNLLAVGYRRLYVDVYWSSEGDLWGLCPIDTVGARPTSTIPTSAPSGDITSSRASAINPSSTSAAVNSKKKARAAQERSESGPEIYNLGPYSCTQSLNISTLSAVLEEYFLSTENTINANMLYLIINMHAAGSSDSPDEPPKTPDLSSLPSPSRLLGRMLGSSLRNFIYSPARLMENRQNLNESWFSVSPSQQPIAEYLTTTVDSKHHLATANGWPSTGFAVLARASRLIMGWGTIDPQMSSYNFTGDPMVFPPNSLTSRIDIQVDAAANLTKGCLYDPSSTGVSTDDHTWAVAELPQRNSSDEIALLTRQFVSCGISPVVNYTLLNVTADRDIGPYRNVSFSTTWSWAKDEPLNSTGSTSSKTRNSYRCAAMDAALSGKWRAHECSDEFRVACRVGNSPYDWIISEKTASYFTAAEACPERTAFSVPRTALENTYLYSKLHPQRNVTTAILPDTSDKDSGSSQSVWIDFNSADVPSCWVTHGAAAQCPYELDTNEIERRAILVPTIAAIIVLILTALTLFVKCNANRRNSRRRRVIDGWDYEGVPS
ncbi:lectin C-type domain-containing protein [Arthroderma uncinatum]|uniref:lectin C-type domain-containing protein n=1 Tax=Arthroderma uncinatum TaxID=74035 RepID=UPI00144AAB7F|nr:lectin C-type domain-containing protein [Arthroderma uncinatum]KAF3480499.1 lectin C-type domain-containing protein [Arthroderma uncinatum]